MGPGVRSVIARVVPLPEIRTRYVATTMGRPNSRPVSPAGLLVELRIASINHDISPPDRILSSHILFLLGHPDRLPLPAHCLAVAFNPAS